MVRIAPVRLAFNPKTLWFDAKDFDLRAGDEVVVLTSRGNEFGTLSSAVFEAGEREERQLKSPLKPVVRLATEDDAQRSRDLERKATEALPLFRKLAAETVPDMNPIAVEYLFEGDKAVFYFDSEERVDFRDLVRKLASEFHVRVDMKQVGVRDGARMVGGLGHCGQELCCRRLGGEFNPVSIRMAKEQDLSLNPAKISGICGRLMCCLRYEYEAYKDFHSRAPKKNAKIATPDGEGKVVDLDVPREIISVKVGDEKPVKVPLADFEPADDGARPKAIGQEAWDVANEPVTIVAERAFSLFSDQLSGQDKLAEPGQMRRVNADEKKPPRRPRRRGSSTAAGAEKRAESAKAAQGTGRKQRRRRSTTVTAEGDMQVKDQAQQAQKQRKGAVAEGEGQPKAAARRRSRGRSAKPDSKAQASDQKKNVQVGRKSSGLRSGRASTQQSAVAETQGQHGRSTESEGRRRRRSHKGGTDSAQTQE